MVQKQTDVERDDGGDVDHIHGVFQEAGLHRAADESVNSE